jgi:hypothetical protein
MSSASRTNGRPALSISTIPALDLDLPATGSAWLVCPDCRCWVEVVRGLVQTHKPEGRRCDGSAQLLTFDLTAAQHAARRRQARARLATGTAPAATVRTSRAVFVESARRTARRVAAHTDQARTVASLRSAGKSSTTMAAAFEVAWERATRIPVATATAHLGAGRPVHPNHTSGHSATVLDVLDRAAKSPARHGAYAAA